MDPSYEYDAPRYYDFKREDDGTSMASRWFDDRMEDDGARWTWQQEMHAIRQTWHSTVHAPVCRLEIPSWRAA